MKHFVGSREGNWKLFAKRSVSAREETLAVLAKEFLVPFRPRDSSLYITVNANLVSSWKNWLFWWSWFRFDRYWRTTATVSAALTKWQLHMSLGAIWLCISATVAAVCLPFTVACLWCRPRLQTRRLWHHTKCTLTRVSLVLLVSWAAFLGICLNQQKPFVMCCFSEPSTTHTGLRIRWTSASLCAKSWTSRSNVCSGLSRGRPLPVTCGARLPKGRLWALLFVTVSTESFKSSLHWQKRRQITAVTVFEILRH